MENKKKGFPLDNKKRQIIKRYDPNAKLIEYKNKSTVTQHPDKFKRLIQANKTNSKPPEKTCCKNRKPGI